MVAAVDHQSGWFLLLVVHQQNNQLTVTGIRSMMRTFAAFVGQACHLQVKGLHESEAGSCKLLGHPSLHDITGLFESKERN